MVESVNRQLRDIKAWRNKWQVTFSTVKIQAEVILLSKEDVRELQANVRVGNYMIYLQDRVDIIGL